MTAATNGAATYPVAVDAAVTRYRLLTLSSGVAVHTAIDTALTAIIGVAEDTVPTVANGRTRGNTVSVLPLAHAGEVYLTSAGTIDVGDALELGADGKVDDADGTGTVAIPFVAAEAAAAGEVFKAIRSLA